MKKPTYEQRLERLAAKRLAAYKRIGRPSAEVLAPIIGPRLLGGPEWPTRPAWRAIRREHSVVLASDALSDPWEDREGAGYAMEVFMEAPGALWPEGSVLTALAGTWLFSAVSEVSVTVAGHGGMRALLDELGVLWMELDGERFPEHLRDEAGRVGVLLGVPARGAPARVDYGDGLDARLVAITLLTRDEHAHVREVGGPASAELVALLEACPTGHRSVPDRASVLGDRTKSAGTKKPAPKKPAPKKAAPKKPAPKKKSAVKKR